MCNFQARKCDIDRRYRTDRHLYSARFELEESDRAFAFAEWEFSRVCEHPAPTAARFPFGRVLLYTIDNIDNSDDPAELELTRKANPIFLFDCREVLRSRERPVRTGVDQQRAAMTRSPRTVLDVFVSVHDEPCPRLANR